MSDVIAGLPADFFWGVATSAYQIEGAYDEDGRTLSIWDTFSRRPGAVENGETGDVACDHYHRMPSDVEMIARLGVDKYRFSVSWPRIQPGGRGPVNPRGIDFYSRLVDELLDKGVDPWLTLYHWDLPQELEDAGGWPHRDTAYRFAEFAGLVHDALGDRVPTWTTLNEPWCSAMLGYDVGRHAPGRTNFAEAMRATHHLLLAHGLAARELRTRGVASLGITLNMGTHSPASDDPRDVDAARRADGLGTRIYLDPLVHGRYPEDVLADIAARGAEIPVRPGDLEIISTPLDVFGVNYYTSHVHRATDDPAVSEVVPQGRPVTAMGWEIVPEGFTSLLVRLHQDYGVPMVITENGAAFDDLDVVDGHVADTDRVEYLKSHVEAVAAAVRAGADVRGYLAWSLMDNFEWGYGYGKRFGIVRVDYETQERTLKQSARWFRDLITRTGA
ncbi:GH1 family beta-glucosidase [Lentzea flaviverrucosa]|uniref:Beta-glucosidase n=1 Tax=Lentzea flaviverrucosa TaxID=200379 RepID=A0A1H9KHJ0_9PSEU|nr:GH1 family beta-glucosidase [Lentzea flaviverrucosa]RDI17879.1 beta-glucosidase [Lentzea flaviverrucosa]SEQ98610.1 beta-glucosidase [Lentzea flaviverrucosa]